ncbi:hypothetical protein WA026_013975 [Henosepilachna vigintioctopunctata]|uniref:Protein SPT2 homolog n=1 Tax=Henosepilachna vigintioctopunctata TaxID=420089 RepID=A0AAW1TYB4_9CUCU
MDFGTILHKAQKNEVTKKEPIRYYSTKFEPPKKEQRNKNQVAINVKKFLEKKEQEEKQKRLEALKKKEELLALRSKDKKAVKRVSVMLKRTKSANQSVIEDAVDSDNTALTLAGPAQPDEDDYGYVSQEASAFYNKMMEKYNKMPEEPPKFLTEKRKVSTNLNNTKDRVKAALEREKEEALMPHKRKRKPKNLDDDSVQGSDDKHEEVEEKHESKKLKVEKPKPKAPPPMNFADLIKLAEKKQFEPIIIDKKPKEKENPLTKKQKKELERVREWEERKNDKNKMPASDKRKSADHQNPIGENVKDKVNKSSSTSILADALTKNKTKVSSSSKTEKLSEKPEVINKPKIDWGPKHPGAGRLNNSNNSSLIGQNSKLSHGSSSSKSESTQRSSKPATGDVRKPLSNTVAKPKPNDNLKPKASLSKDSLKVSNATNYRKTENAIVSQERPLDRMKPKEFPPRDMMRPKQFPPTDMRKPMSRPNKMKVNKGRIMDDDDEEEDSEMDDFIDDGPEEEEDYSKYISEIFGYNKSKYARYDDEDDALMESSYAQQMKEEVISTKMGIMEDLEDMKLEEEHKRRKALMKKKLSKKR